MINFNYTHNNHFRFGWGEGLFNFADKHEPYWVDFGRAEYIPDSFRSECLRTAKLIRESVDKPILVCFSGGIDSEVIVRSFQEQQIPIEVAIMKINYKGMLNVNSHDNQYAFDYARKNNIKINVFEFDIEKYVRNVYPVQASIYGDYFGSLIHNEIIRSFPKYHCVLGGGDTKLKRHRYNGRPSLPGMFIEEGIVSISGLEAALEHNGTVNNRFYIHTPEIMLAWLMDKDIAHWIRIERALASKFGNINFHLIKAFVLYRHWPELEVRPKFNGYERLGLWKTNDQGLVKDQELINIIQNVEKEHASKTSNDVIINYEDLLDKLMPKQ